MYHSRGKIIHKRDFNPLDGFSLIEILVVITIVSLLCGIAGYGIIEFKEKACLNLIRYDMKKFFEAQHFALDKYDAPQGEVSDVLSENPNISSTFSLKNYKPSIGTTITITKDDPFTAVGKNGGVSLTFEWDITTDIISEVSTQ